MASANDGKSVAVAVICAWEFRSVSQCTLRGRQEGSQSAQTLDLRSLRRDQIKTLPADWVGPLPMMLPNLSTCKTSTSLREWPCVNAREENTPLAVSSGD